MSNKERDNTWLQLQVCPVVWRQRDEETAVLCPEGDEKNQTPPSPCRMSYAHPPTHVLKQALEAGFVVSCQAFVFATYAPDDGTVNRPNCRRGEANCKYFHPPKHLSLQVINMGRNNKRMKSEMLAKIKMQYQQQQAVYATTPAFNPMQAWPQMLYSSMLPTMPNATNASLATNAAAAAAAAIPRHIPTIPTTMPNPVSALMPSTTAPLTGLVAELRSHSAEDTTASLRKRRSRSPSNLQSGSGFEKSPEAKRRSRDDDVVQAMTAQALQQMPYYYTSAASTAGGFIPASFVYPFYDPRYQQ